MRDLSLGLLALSLVSIGCGSSSVESTVSSGTANVNAPGSSPPDTADSSGGAPGDSVSKDWVRFRGPAADGSSAAQVPLKWSLTENIAWKTPMPGPGASSPIVLGDRIYLTAYSGYAVPDQPGGSLNQLKRHLIAMQLSDGKVVWDKALAAKLPEEAQIRDHGYAANTPIADDEMVYTFLGKSGVVAFDHNGNQKWEASVGTRTNGWGTASSPILHNDLLIVNASVESDSLVALDRKTGQEKWRAPGIKESWNTPVIVTAPSGRKELIVAIMGKVLAFNPDNGQPLWSCNTDITWYMVPSPVVADGVVYYLGGRSGVASLAVRAGGSGDVTASHRLWTSNKGSNVSSPVFHDGHLYYMNDQRGTAYCAKADSGENVYEQRLDRAGQVYSSALLASGRVYYLTRDGKTFVVAANPKFEQLAVNELRDGGQFNGSPAVAGNQLLIRSDKFLYCIGK